MEKWPEKMLTGSIDFSFLPLPFICSPLVACFDFYQSGNVVPPQYGGPGCKSGSSGGDASSSSSSSGVVVKAAPRWMVVSFPSAKDESWPHSNRSTCVITTEAEEGWEDDRQYIKGNQRREEV
jgi:hypothetical protein